MRTVTRTNQCTDDHCMHKVEYSVVNTVQFRKKAGQLICSLCNKNNHRTFPVRRAGIWLSKAAMSKCFIMEITQALLNVHHKRGYQRMFSEESNRKPSHVQTAYILSMVKPKKKRKSGQTSDRAVKPTKRISNRKQDMTKETEPYGHNFEASRILNIAMQKTRFTFIK